MMRSPESWSLRLRVFLFFALLAVVVVVVDTASWVLAGVRIAEGRPVGATHVLFGLVSSLVVVGSIAWVWMKFDEHVARAVQAAAASLRTVVHAASSGATAPPARFARYLGPLNPAVREAIDALIAARAQMDHAVAVATNTATIRTRRLEAVLQDLDQGVVICNLNHEILLYNRKALEILHVTGEIGLGRSLFSLIDGRPISQALSRVRARFGRDGALAAGNRAYSIFVGTGADGETTIKGRVSLTLTDGGREPIGYAIALEDVTAELSAGIQRDRHLHRATEEIRQRIASVFLVGELLVQAQDHASGDAELSATARQAFADERQHLTEILDRMERASSDLLASAWPMGEVFAPLFLEQIADRVREEAGVDCTVEAESFWIRCDPGSLTDLLDHLALRLAEHDPPRGVRLVGAAGGDLGHHIDLVPDAGTVVTMRDLDAWLDEPLGATATATATVGGITGRDILFRHKTNLWPITGQDGTVRVRVPVTQSEAPATVRADLEARPEFYDFDLTARVPHARIDDRPLDDLSYVVFDCETTGLEPSRGDRVVSLAGVRVVNGRRLRGEVFQALVNPGRHIPSASTRIHGITDAMVAGADSVERVLTRFTAFADGAVLVAHNAAFDMSFVAQEAAGATLAAQPVIDTVLLAAHVFGADQPLTLDSLAERFGITIEEADRHTALGDAVATADVLINLFGLLKAAGVSTLRDAVEASELQAAIRRRQRAY
ncbi:MAG: hypothetical protein H6843_13080 [Rhodospirillaceae bacterium]|nr:hypothetical protein [Rhodospirillaceae bacterium]